MEKFKISVIIPVYGVEKYIRQCLESVINQTYKNLEIIVVNDGTKDNSMRIVEEYLSDERIKVINKENGGLSSARNRGMEEATGEYISFVDSDDWIDLNLYLEIMKEVKEEDIIIFNYTKFYEKNNKYERNVLCFNEIILYDNFIFYEDINGECWNKLYKKTYLDNINIKFIENMIYEDIVWGIEILSQTTNIKLIEKGGYFYRVNRNGSITNTISLFEAKTPCQAIIINIEKLIKENRIENKKIYYCLKFYQEMLKSYIEGKYNFKDIDILFKDYFFSLDRNAALDKKLREKVKKILREKNTIGINLFDFFYWKEKIYNYNLIIRILKNKLRRKVKKYIK